MPHHDDDEREQIARAFDEAVNMTQSELRKWLDTEDSRSVGMTHEGQKVTGEEDGEAVGHQLGRRILEIRARKAAARGDDDYDAMRKAVGYVHRHGKQKPSGDVIDTRWRHSLMNWGHDPLKR